MKFNGVRKRIKKNNKIDLETVFLKGASILIYFEITKHFVDLDIHNAILPRKIDKLKTARKGIADRKAKFLTFISDVLKYASVDQEFKKVDDFGPINTVIAERLRIS